MDTAWKESFMWREMKKAVENQTHTQPRVTACVELCSWRSLTVDGTSIRLIEASVLMANYEFGGFLFDLAQMTKWWIQGWKIIRPWASDESLVNITTQVFLACDLSKYPLCCVPSVCICFRSDVFTFAFCCQWQCKFHGKNILQMFFKTRQVLKWLWI